MLKVYLDVLVVIEVRILNHNDFAWKIFFEIEDNMLMEIR